MRLVLQRVSSAAVRVGSETVAEIGVGMLILAGVEKGDGPETVERAAEKLSGLRIFADREGRMNVDLKGASGKILLVSQFTLAASTARGRRPSFDRAAAPELARELLGRLEALLRAHGLEVVTGSFGATMEVALVNDGPVTFVLDF